MLVGLVFLISAAVAQAALHVQIVNKTGRPDRSVFVMLAGGSADASLTPEHPVRLSQIAKRGFMLRSLSSGRLFFSYGAPVTDAEPPRAPVRYDKVELTYPGVANLTAVDFFSIPFRLQTIARNGRARGTLGYSAPTREILSAFERIRGARRAIIKTRDRQFARVLSPQLSPTSYPSFDPYIRSMAGRRVIVNGAFYGTPFQLFSYSGTFTRNGSIVLRGTIRVDGRAAAGEPLSVNGPALAPAIYTIDGPYSWGGATHHVSDNDVYAAIYRDLISGFAWGYWGGRYPNDTLSWDGLPPFGAARIKRTSYAAYNEYAAVIYRYSDAYGFSFSDTGPKKVQLPLDTPTLRITILPDRSPRHR